MGLHYQQRLKPEPPTKANEYTPAPPQLIPPFMEDFMVNNPDKPTTTWYTASECKLVCALTLYVNTRENPPESIKKHGKCRDAHIHEMHDEMIRYLRFIFCVPWLSARLDSSGLYDHIKGSNHKPLRNLYVEVREDKYGFWNARARATFQWWVMLRTPLRERLKHEDAFKKMPDGTCVRQDSALEKYDDAKPILDAESFAERHPQTYPYAVKLMPITQWLFAISIKCMLRPLPLPPRIPYWPCNMVLTEDIQPPGETSPSPQHHGNRREKRRPAGKKPRGRRYNVPGIHVESLQDLPRKGRTSPPHDHLFVNQTYGTSAQPGFLQPPRPLQTKKTARRPG